MRTLALRTSAYARSHAHLRGTPAALSSSTHHGAPIPVRRVPGLSFAPTIAPSGCGANDEHLRLGGYAAVGITRDRIEVLGQRHGRRWPKMRTKYLLSFVNLVAYCRTWHMDMYWLENRRNVKENYEVKKLPSPPLPVAPTQHSIFSTQVTACA